MQNWNLCTFVFFRSSQSEREIQTSLGLCDVMDYKIPLTQLLGSFRFIMLSPFLFECAHIHRPSQCSEAVLEQLMRLSQITGSKINQTSMDVHLSCTEQSWLSHTVIQLSDEFVLICSFQFHSSTMSQTVKVDLWLMHRSRITLSQSQALSVFTASHALIL